MRIPQLKKGFFLFTDTAPENAGKLLEWVEALESGKFKQGTSHLRQGDEYCCLGVGCEVLNMRAKLFQATNHYAYRNQTCYLPTYAKKKLSLTSVAGSLVDEDNNISGKSLTELNDHMVSFKRIATHIRNAYKHQFGKTLEKAGK